MILDDIKKYILVHLGASRIAVELSDIDLEECVRSTLLLYSKYKPIRLLEAISLNSIFTEKTPPELNIYGVINVDIAHSFETTQYETDAFLFAKIPVWQTHTPKFTWSLVEYEIIRKWVQLTGRILGANPDWYFDRYTKKLWIWMPSGTGHATITWVKQHKFPEDLDKILLNDEKWFYDYALAEAKEVLGRIRSKYDAIPGGGENFTLDGKDLISEATAEKEKLLEKLLSTTADLSLWIK